MLNLPIRFTSTYYILAGLIGILVLIGWLGINVSAAQRSATWLQVLALMSVFVVLVGRGITGHWRGILIDRRNKMSLSRLQLLAWTLLILSAILIGALSNVSAGSAAPLEIEIPSQLFTLMGISVAGAVGSMAVLSSAEQKKVDRSIRDNVADRLHKNESVKVDPDNDSIVVRNIGPSDARWGDLLKGDEVGTAESVDMGKLHMFFFTFILIVGYGAAVSVEFGTGALITKIPAVQDGMNVLLGISHTGYLAAKAITQTPTVSGSN